VLPSSVALPRPATKLHGPPHLFRRQVFERVFAPRRRLEFLANAGAEQVAQLRQVEVAMHTTPAAHLVMVQTQFLFGLAKTTLQR
jgi:hypothetical protein